MTNESAPEGSTTPSRILVIEDDKLMQTFYTSLFRRHASEFEFELKDSAEAALNHLNQHQVDAVILDWDLPLVNGLDILKAMRAHPRTKALPVIMATGRSAPADRALAEKHGVSAFFVKPFNPTELLDRLRALLRPGNQ